MVRSILLSLIIALSLTAVPALAADPVTPSGLPEIKEAGIPTLKPTLGKDDFTPIVGIPLPGSNDLATSGNLTDYINAIFQLTLAAGAGLAAIYIAIGGMEYILSEALEGKKTGRERITHAVYGLIILLLVTIILYVINPDAVCLEVFSSGGTCIK